SKVLLGSIKRKNLAKLLAEQLSRARRLRYILEQSRQPAEAVSDQEIHPCSDIIGSDGE
ncbi:hypothetical protein scyTo_0023890, partial [Scyliorhinus torazame]|nr:hypothetical protein [Scyliorhinus torazame]